MPTRTQSQYRGRAVLAVMLALAACLATPSSARAATPLDSPFYRYDGATPLEKIPPGTVLKTRTTSYHVAGLPLPVSAVQLLYRSTSQVGHPTTNVTTVLRPLISLGKPKVVSYQSFYDSLNPADQPSATIAGGTSLGGAAIYIETALFAPLLLAGYSINIPDTQGQRADFGAGPEYAMNTLDSVRAILKSSKLAMPKTTKVAMMGYSGGAIAAEWAAEMVAPYAPDLTANIVGTAIGGVLVNPARNLKYVDGSGVWAGMMPMGAVGLSRAFEIDLKPYMSERGIALMRKMDKHSIIQVLGAYPGLTWTQIGKPAYETPEKIPLFVTLANKLIMSTAGTPTAPLLIGQGTGGELEGTRGNKPGIGAGDGVMIAGDVRTLAREYCGRGVRVQYNEYTGLSHFMGIAPWIAQATPWLMARFSDKAAPTNCSSIKPGNGDALKPLAAPR